MSHVASVPVSKNSRLVIRYLTPLWPQTTLLGLLLVLTTGLQVWAPQVIREFIDKAMSDAGLEILLRLAALYTALAVVRHLSSAWGQYIGEDIGWRATNNLRSDLTRHCLGLDMSYHKNHRAGELVERIDGDTGALAGLFSQFVAGVAVNLMLLAATLVFLFRINWLAGVTVCVSSSSALYALWKMREGASPLWAKVREETAQFYGTIGEWLQGMEDIKASGATGWVLRRFHENTRLWYPRHCKAMIARFKANSVSLFLLSSGTAAALAVAAALLLRRQISLGTAFAIFTYAEMIRRPLEQIGTQLRSLHAAGGSLGRVTELLAVSTALPASAASPRTLPSGPLGVELEDVGFSYDEGEEVLSGVSFSVRPGRVLGILGRTGSGKTTIARLLFRFYDPSSGKVRIGGVDMREVGLTELRARVGLVTQDVQLFQSTVRDNVAFFSQDVSDRQVTDALRWVGLGPLLESLPQGLDTVMGPGGAGLSAGEAQLMAFARLHLREIGLVVLDEASSRLDPLTESMLEAAASKVLKNRTGVIIAHRLATLHKVDDIVIIEDGRVAECGERSELANDPASRYSRLLKTGIEEVRP